MRLVLCRSLGALVLLLAVVPAFAALTTFSDYNNWSSAASGITTINFNLVGAGNATSYTLGVSPDQVTFTPLGDTYLAVSIPPSPYWPGCDVLCLAATYNGQNGIAATQATNAVTAIGFNLFSATLAGQPMTIKVYYVGNGTGTPDSTTSITDGGGNIGATPTFFGITSDTAIQKIEITSAQSSGQGTVVIDNYSFGLAQTQGQEEPPPTDTAEAASLMYVGMGLVALLLGRRKGFAGQACAS